VTLPETAKTTKPTKKRRRWHRFAIPYGVVLLLFLISGVAYMLEEPDFDDPGTLSPTGTGPDGSSRLAAMLTARGVTIERYTSSVDIVTAARAGNVTVFVPGADLMHPLLPWILTTGPDSNRLVLAEPGIRTVLFGGMPIAPGPRRWAAATRPPRCTDPVAVDAGRATTYRRPYVPVDFLDPAHEFETTHSYSCYDGGVVGTQWRGMELVLVGATEPFRNSRIGEYGNAKLTTALLATKPRVLWLDIHAKEPRSYSEFEGAQPGLDLPDNEGGQPGGGRDEPNPLLTAFPPWVWAVVGQLAVVAVLLALWQARRLGPPVAEPLPVTVPAAETITGRGRLYARADARDAAISSLRSAVRHRIAPLLDLPREAPDSDVVQAVATRTGIPPEQVRSVLFGPEPDDDDELLAAVAALDDLAHRLSFSRNRSDRD